MIRTDTELLSQIIEDAGWSARCLELAESEIHHQLAGLKLPLYLTTNFDNFMTLALRSQRGEDEEGKVRREVIDWRREVVRQAGVLRLDCSYIYIITII